MSKRKRRNHLPVFKVKVARAALKGEKTLAELVQQIGELTLTDDFLSGALGKAGLLSAKR